MAEEGQLHSAVSSLIAQATDRSVRSVTQSWDIDEQRRELEDLLRALQLHSSALSNAELKAEKDPAVRTWVRQFMAAVHGARDLLNRIKLHEKRRARIFASQYRRMASLVRKLKKVVDRLDVLGHQLYTLGLVESQEEGPLASYGSEMMRSAWEQESSESEIDPDAETEELSLRPKRLLSEDPGSDNSEPDEAERDLEVGHRPLLYQQRLAESGGDGERDPDANLPLLSTATPQDVPADEIQKRCSKYSTRALGFALATFAAYLGSASSSSSGNVFRVAMAAYIIAVTADLVSATKKKPEWGSALVYLSSFLLVLVSYLLLVTFNKGYAYAILPVPPLPIVVAFLHQHKQRQQRSSSSNDKGDDDEVLDKIFEVSAGIVNGGGLITLILGHYMVGPNHHVSAVGFLFFFTIVLGLYLMMATTVRSAALTRHAKPLAYLQIPFIVGTIIAILIHIFHR